MKFLSPVDVDGYISLITQNPGVTPTKYLIQDANGRIAFRTGQELRVDIGADYTSVLKHQVKASVAINKGQAVYAIPTQDGTNILVGLASNNSEATSSKTMGLLNATVSTNGFADVITEGLLSGLNTSTATVGNPVWLGTNGNLIYGLAAKPYAPAHLVFIGIVTRVNANNGEIFVKVQNGFELDELHDVDLKTTTPINGHLLGFNGTLWVNKTIAGWLGYTPQDAATAITTSNIGSQSVNYANSAAVATNADYANAAGYAENAGTLDGYDSSYFAVASHTHIISPVVETLVPQNGISIQAGPGGGNGAYGWEYPYGTRLSAITGAGRSFEIMSTTYPGGELVMRTLGSGSVWDPWKKMLDTSNYSGYSNFSGAVYGTIYYDANNTSYYIDPASYSRLNQLSIGSVNTSYLLYNNGNSYFNGSVEIDDTLYVSSGYSVRAPIFYDIDNTGYYLDPASTSNLNALTLAGTFSAPGYNKTNWDTAYGWGNHALAGYVPQGRTITINGVGYDLSANRSWTITASETDTLATVTARGASTSTAVTLSSSGNTFGGHHYFSSYDANGNHYPHYNNGSNNNGSKLNLRMFDSSGNAVVFYLNGNDKSIQWNGSTIWTSGNHGSGSGLNADLLDGQHASAFASSSHTHDLGRYSLRPPSVIDALTTNNFRSTLFGSSANDYNISTARWNGVPGPLSGLNAYGTMLAWAGADTHGFVAMDYNARAAIIGGGNGEYVNWYSRLLMDDAWINNKYFSSSGEIHGTVFYDANNSAYYINPASTSNLYGLTVNQTISGNITSANYLSILGGSGGNLNTMGYGRYYNYGSGSYWTNGPSGMSYGSVYNFGGSSESVLSLQLAADINHNSTSSTRTMWFRTGNNLGFQNDWKEILHTGNYSSFANPTIYKGVNAYTNFQSFVSTPGTIRFDQCNATGGFSNAPGGYTYGGVLSMRGDNFGYQLWGSHTGDFYFKTQWQDDQYSGWRAVLHSGNYLDYAWQRSGSWKPASLSSSTRLVGTASPDGGEFGLAYSGGQIHPYTDGFFYQNEGQYRVIDSNSISSQSVNYANSAGSSSSSSRANYLDPNYIGGGQSNPQTYFNNGIGVKVAMTAQAGYWSDTLWINGYTGGDVPWMCALHTQRNSSPRMYISAQQHTSSSYGTLYEFWTNYNMDAPNKSGTSYYQTNTWMQFNGSYGLYWPSTYGAHFAPNSTSTYTQFRTVGSKNGYGGIYDEYSAVNGMMYDSAGNGGIYREANGRWYLYHHVGNNCTGISTSTTSGSYRAYIGGSLYAEGDIVAYSDRRKKENIITVDNALDTVNKLRGVYYNRIDDDSKRRQVGVIAQETQEVLPEVVTYAEDIDEYGVAYGNITGVLIEAIKEQQTQIEELKQLVNQLINK